VDAISLPASSGTPPPTPTDTPAGPTATPTPTTNPAITPTNTPTTSAGQIYLSLSNAGPTTIGTLTGVNDEDVIYYDGSTWSMFFDGSDVDITGELSSFYKVDSDTFLFTLAAATTISPIGAVDNHDIIQFDATSLGSVTAGTFSLYFDGEDVEFADPLEFIDALDVLPDGRLVVSTEGSPIVTGITDGKDEDLLVFTPTTLGTNTSGTWAMYFDGSDVNLNGAPDVDGVDIGPDGRIYLTTHEPFAVSGISGDNEDVFVCIPISLGVTTSCSFEPALYFDGSLWGLAADDVDAIDIP
jgi:hypothetical protein